MESICISQLNFEKPLLAVKGNSGQIGKFIKSEKGGLLFFTGTIAYNLVGMSASAITSFLATIGFGSMILGIILTFLTGYFLPKLWSVFWSLIG